MLIEPRFTLAVAAAAAFVLGTFYVVAPAAALEPWGFDEPDEVWIRVVGVLAIAIGILHTAGAIADQRWYYVATVVERVTAGLLQIVLAATIGPWQLAAFGCLDIVGAAWTAIALTATSPRREPSVR